MAYNGKQYYLKNKKQYRFYNKAFWNDIIQKLENEQEQKEFLKQLNQNANLSKKDKEFFNSL
jgi:hypothetical protein